MAVPDVLQLAAVLCAALCGMALAWYLFARIAQARRYTTAARSLANEASGAMPELEPECDGVAARVMSFVRRESIRVRCGDARRAQGLSRIASRFLPKDFDRLIEQAGCKGMVSREGAMSARLRLVVAGAGLGALAGCVFSFELAIVGALAGLCLGWRAVPWAFQSERDARSERLEAQLGELAEVVALGLRSGLSFDRSLELYTVHFSTSLSRACAAAMRQWSFSLTSRDTALRDLAASYGSPLFARTMEGTIRSLRFGESLAEGFEAASSEARSVHWAKVEERVAKAPVKMLIPVGTLILPAMLVLVLGPILIELMTGM